MKTPWGMKSEEECFQSLGSALQPGNYNVYCNATWDEVLCWPAARPGTTIRLPCPPMWIGIDPTKYGYRTCNSDGRWDGDQPNGFTNFTNCFTPEAMELYKKYFLDKTPQEMKMLRDVVSSIRIMDVVGLCLSLITSLISLFVFTYFRSLRCHRTRIHRNLFVAIIIQVFIRLVVYIDQFVARNSSGQVPGKTSGTGAIYNTPVLCEFLYVLLEYSKTVQFMWMLIEGLYLHNQIAVSVFSKKPNYTTFYIVGYGGPVPVTFAWATVMAFTFKSQCWYPYYFLPYIWIIEAPRICVLFCNLLFLLNIIRVLVLKLRDSHTHEAQVVKVRKAIKAALFLLPLLGITNALVMIEGPTDPVEFAVLFFSSHFLVSFQGFIISVLYCFLNGEVQDTLCRQFCTPAPVYTEYSRTSIRLFPVSGTESHNMLSSVQQTLRKRWYRYHQSRLIHNSSFRRLSRSFSAFTSLTEAPNTSIQFRGQVLSPTPINMNGMPLLRELITRQESGPL